MRVGKWVPLLSSSGFFFFGLWALYDPESMLGFVGLDRLPPAARVDVRAFYGGLEIGFGGFLVWSARRRERFEPAIVASFCVFAGCAITRFLAAIGESTYDWALVAAGLGELSGALFNAWAWRALRQVRRMN